MPNIAAIRSLGSSLEAYLNNAYRASTFPPNVTKPNCTFSLTSIGGVRASSVASSDTMTRVLIFLYRVSMNPHLRNVGRVTNPGARPVPMSVDLHYLFSFWAASGENEQLVLAWTMRQLHQTPVLDGSILSREAAWGAEDVIQLIPEEISNEDMMRIWGLARARLPAQPLVHRARRPHRPRPRRESARGRGDPLCAGGSGRAAMNLELVPRRQLESESVYRRILGAFILVDAVTRVPLSIPATIQVRRATVEGRTIR